MHFMSIATILNAFAGSVQNFVLHCPTMLEVEGYLC